MPGQVITGVESPGIESVSVTSVRVTLPVLVNRMAQVIVLPTPPEPAVIAPDLVTATAPAAGTVCVFAAVAVGRMPPSASVPTTLAVLATEPLSTSAWVSGRVAVAVTDWPACRVPAVPDGHVPYVSAESPDSGSVMPTFVSVPPPVLVAVKV